MEQYHFSTAQCFDNCEHRFQLTYRQELQTLPTDDPQNPLILGTAIHRGMETDVDTAISEYFNSYPVIDDRHVTEAIKIRHWVTTMKELIPEGLHEVPFKNDIYMGTADLLVPVVGKEDWFDLYDYKYSNNIDHYMESGQLHVYKYYLEQIKGIKIHSMFFVFVPKVMIRQGKTEDIQSFRRRLMKELESKEIQIREVQFDITKVADFHRTCMKIGLSDGSKKTFSYLCDWCEFADYCKKGIDYMILPSNERRSAGQIAKKKVWIYGASFTGKTTMCDSAPDPLNLNTDGNIEFVSMPYVHIGDQVTVEGRQTKKTFGWEVFKDAIKELQTTAGSNGFKTIIVDLIEDVYEMCRLYMYDKLGITHESDDTFRAWDKVRTEFLSTMREFFGLPYENLIIISKEDMSRDITRKSGDKVTQIKPNLQDKVSVKIAGMVDIVVRTVVEDDGQHTLQFKTSEVVFGGGRLKHIDQTTIPCDWNELMKVYADATGSPAIIAPTEPAEDPKEEPAKSTSDDPKEESAEEPAQEEEKPKRGRRSRKSDDPAPAEDTKEEPAEDTKDTPVRRQRKRRERA